MTILEVDKEFSIVADRLDIKDAEVFIDLSQIRFAELAAINFLVLNVESSCKKRKIKELYVALPTLTHTANENSSVNPEFIEELRAKLLKGRKKANSFLKNTKFVSAIRDGLECKRPPFSVNLKV